MEKEINFESQLLRKMDIMGENLAAINERLTAFEGETKTAFMELSGKVKGNYELITRDLSNYVEKDICTDYREKQGSRLGRIEERVQLIEYRFNKIEDNLKERQKTTSEAVIAWLPDMLKVVAVLGAVLYLISKGSISI